MNQGPGNHQTTLHTAGEHTCRGVPLLPESELFQILFSRRRGLFKRNSVVAGLGGDNVEDLFELVEVELLRHNTKVQLGIREMGVGVISEHPHLSGCFVNQGANNTQGGRFACPIGPQQGKEVPLGDVQINPLESLEAVTIGFGEALNFQCIGHNSSRFGEKRQRTALAASQNLDCYLL